MKGPPAKDQTDCKLRRRIRAQKNRRSIQGLAPTMFHLGGAPPPDCLQVLIEKHAHMREAKSRHLPRSA